MHRSNVGTLFTSQEVDLFVVQPPLFTNTSESSLEVMNGVSTHLMCRAVGVPRPTISWKRQGGATINLQHRYIWSYIGGF